MQEKLNRVAEILKVTGYRDVQVRKSMIHKRWEISYLSPDDLYFYVRVDYDDKNTLYCFIEPNFDYLTPESAKPAMNDMAAAIEFANELNEILK